MIFGSCRSSYWRVQIFQGANRFFFFGRQIGKGSSGPSVGGHCGETPGAKGLVFDELRFCGVGGGSVQVFTERKPLAEKLPQTQTQAGNSVEKRITS